MYCGIPRHPKSFKYLVRCLAPVKAEPQEMSGGSNTYSAGVGMSRDVMGIQIPFFQEQIQATFVGSCSPSNSAFSATTKLYFQASMYPIVVDLIRDF